VNLTRLDGSTTVEIKSDIASRCFDPALTTQNGRTYLAYTYITNKEADWRHLHVIDITDQLQ
jgi:hypothetical protein